MILPRHHGKPLEKNYNHRSLTYTQNKYKQTTLSYRHTLPFRHYYYESKNRAHRPYTLHIHLIKHEVKLNWQTATVTNFSGSRRDTSYTTPPQCKKTSENKTPFSYRSFLIPCRLIPKYNITILPL